MTLDDLLKRLSYSVLSNVFIGEGGNGSIEKESIPKVVNFINLALIALYTRFPLNEKAVSIEMKEAVTFYHLDSKYAVSKYEEGQSNPCYLLDTLAEPFRDDVIKITEVFDGLGLPLPINDETAPLAVFVPRPRSIQIPHPLPGTVVSVSYLARHEPLDAELLDSPVHVPFELQEALESYVGYLWYKNINTQEAMNTCQMHLQNYQRICGDMDERDTLGLSSMYANSKFEMRGFR